MIFCRNWVAEALLLRDLRGTLDPRAGQLGRKMPGSVVSLFSAYVVARIDPMPLSGQASGELQLTLLDRFVNAAECGRVVRPSGQCRFSRTGRISGGVTRRRRPQPAVHRSWPVRARLTQVTLHHLRLSA